MLARFIQLARRLLTFFIIAIAALGVSSASAQSQSVRYVDITSTAAGGGDGLSWSTAYTQLADALDEALTQTNSEDPLFVREIWCADGSYRPDQDIKTTPIDHVLNDRAETFSLRRVATGGNSELNVMGGFRGLSHPSGGETNKNERRPYLYPTILTGEINTASVDDNSYHVVSAISRPVWVAPPQISIDNTKILDGFIIQSGNAIGAPPPVEWNITDPNNPDRIFNVPGTGGGGIFIVGSGGISQPTAHPTVIRCRFLNNKGVYGGAVFHRGSDGVVMKFRNCDLINNTSTSSIGGGLHNYGSGSILRVGECSGINIGNVLLINCKASWNVGGGLYNDSYTTTDLLNSTVAYNGHIGIEDDNSDETCRGISVRNSILWANGASGSSQVAGAYCMEYSIVQNLTVSGSCAVICAQPSTYCAATCGNNLSSNPLFVDHDGPNNVGGDLDDDFRLQSTSPAIDYGCDAMVEDSAVADIYDLNQNGITSEPPSISISGSACSIRPIRAMAAMLI